MDTNWHEFQKDSTSFAKQLRYKDKQSQSTSIKPSESINNINNSSQPAGHARYTSLYRARETNIKRLEVFIENIGSDIFDTAAVRNVRPIILKEEIEPLKEIRLWNNQTVHVQDKGSRFVILENNDYQLKIQIQLTDVDLTEWKKIQVRTLPIRLIVGF